MHVISVVICGYYSDKKAMLCIVDIKAALIDEYRENACYQSFLQLSQLFWALVKLFFVHSNPKKADHFLALMIGFNNSGQKGVLLFSEF